MENNEPEKPKMGKKALKQLLEYRVYTEKEINEILEWRKNDKTKIKDDQLVYAAILKDKQEKNIEPIKNKHGHILPKFDPSWTNALLKSWSTFLDKDPNAFYYNTLPEGQEDKDKNIWTHEEDEIIIENIYHKKMKRGNTSIELNGRRGYTVSDRYRDYLQAIFEGKLIDVSEIERQRVMKLFEPKPEIKKEEPAVINLVKEEPKMNGIDPRKLIIKKDDKGKEPAMKKMKQLELFNPGTAVTSTSQPTITNVEVPKKKRKRKKPDENNNKVRPRKDYSDELLKRIWTRDMGKNASKTKKLKCPICKDNYIQYDGSYGFQVSHIVAWTRDGPDTTWNTCVSCASCNGSGNECLLIRLIIDGKEVESIELVERIYIFERRMDNIIKKEDKSFLHEFARRMWGDKNESLFQHGGCIDNERIYVYLAKYELQKQTKQYNKFMKDEEKRLQNSIKLRHDCHKIMVSLMKVVADYNV